MTPAGGRGAGWTPKIAFLGLGVMGSAMASRLVDANFTVSVYNRTSAKAQELRERGVRVADDPADAACGADVVLVSVSTAEVVEQFLFGPHGALAVLAPDAVVVDLSTVSPDAAVAMAERIAEHGHRALDACVLGNLKHARDGEIRLMIGGESSAVNTLLPVFRTLAKDVRHLGPSGTGAKAKIAMNLLMGAQMQALSEAIVYGVAAGLDRDTLISMIAASGYSSPMMSFKCGAMSSRRFERADFKLSLMRKDLGLVLEQARAAGVPLPVTAAGHNVLTAAVNAGLGDLDCSAVLVELERQAGITAPDAVTPPSIAPSDPQESRQVG